ncbi:beta propeller domain-containing protein [Beggiatoa alba B18LD]|uniref:Beta propeller domain-containing protein n=1 Tax=Beggiatoa alba B18LD TaxID=395493 RepID=I3CDX7_9GAMM|nr:beta-propeller domain-containing protein [Beggiatoa alba]EIJ41820.1 beta propeller domain-containing protein [Beggiatoa alba B18LD]
MQFKHTLLVSALSLVMTMPSFAWQVDVTPATTTESAQITVSNTTVLEEKLVYLVWMDLDASEDKFLSWTTATGWQKGLFPITPTPVKVEKFEKKAIAELSAACPASHRCFVALVATKPDVNPLDSQQWDAVSILPLTTEAGYLRLLGQRFFLSLDNYQSTTAGLPFSGSDSKDNEAETDTGSGTTTTEKPDIFRVVGQKILYANAQARKFQLIDISDVTQPKLTGEIALTGTPREIYTLDDKIVLLQSLYTGEVGTKITVLQQGTGNTLNVVSETQLSGNFLESRRRNDIIYAVTQINANLPMPLLDKSDIACVDCGTPAGLQIVALRLNTTGTLENLKQVELVGYSPTVSIFNDYLVVTNPNPDNWQTSLIQVYQLDIAGNPLQALPSLAVAGRIPSEFHVDVNQQQLRVVFGDVISWGEMAIGSTLAIYNLPNLQLLGKVDKIAPKESLFATRFVGDRAYVVTYERKDPLWVIDLSNPTNPKILGELVIPGWSEKLFFHDNLLLGVGIHDVPETNEENQFVRRVALSLFDVTNPTQPTFINRLVPLAGQTTWSYSQALQDERALLLNWDSELTALPIESWGIGTGSYLQIASLANRQLTDKGLVDMPVAISRSTPINSDTLATLGDQALLTIRWGNTKPTVLGELELGRNLAWIKFTDDKLLAGGYGAAGYSRLYQFSPTETAKPQQHWALGHNYNNITLDGHTAVFYNYNPLSVQTVNTDNNVISPVWTLEENASLDYYNMGYWLERSEPLAYQGHFYIAEKWSYSPVMMEDGTVKPETDATGRLPMQWQLRNWDLTGEKPVEAKAVSIPGRLIGFSSAQMLITQEASATNQLVLNQVRLTGDGATLLNTRELACAPYSQVLKTTDALYIKCDTAYNNIGYPMTTTMGGGADTSADKMASDSITAPVTETETVKTTILKVSLNTNFADLGKWSFDGYQQLQAVSADKVLISEPRYYYYMDTIASSSMPFMGGALTPCNVYQLTLDKEPLRLKEADCSNISASDLSDNSLWFAKGFEGLTKIDLQ